MKLKLLRRVHTTTGTLRHVRRELHLQCGSCVVPLEGKPGDGDGEDAHFYTPRGVGVFDGVGGWSKYGVDPRAYAQALMVSTRAAHLKQLGMDCAGESVKIGVEGTEREGRLARARKIDVVRARRRRPRTPFWAVAAGTCRPENVRRDRFSDLGQVAVRSSKTGGRAGRNCAVSGGQNGSRQI